MRGSTADLERIARANRAAAVRVYRARTGSARNTATPNIHFNVWLLKQRGDKILYEINRNHKVIRQILDERNPSKAWERKLFHLIEKTVPFRSIIQENAEQEDCYVDLPVEAYSPPKELLVMCKQIFLSAVKAGRGQQDAIDYTCAFFDDHIFYRVMLEKIAEGLA